MKHYLLPLIILAFTNLQLYSKSIDEPAAKKIATTFLSSASGTSQLKNGENIELIYKATAPFDQSVKSSSGSEAAQTTYFYIFSSSPTDNFIIVSGDDRAKPILAYSISHPFDPGNIPPNMKLWLDGYINEVQYAIDKDIKADQEIAAQWVNLSQGIGMNSTAILEPLIKTHWNQEPYYNDLCPYDNTLGRRTAAGCIAVPMAQIMKYWQYPTYGIGSHSYSPKSHPEYGLLSADFENSRYEWASMPDQISAPNYEIARLMFHCGVSVEMDYGIDSLGQSSAYIFNNNHPSVFLALKNYFGYKCKFINKSSYPSASEWLNLIKTELDALRPVYYCGDGVKTSDSHAFLCDGYDNNNYFHFNWGWGGYCDGYFSLDAINPEYKDYTNQQRAIIGIEPIISNPEVDLRMNSKVSIEPSVYLKPGQSFTIEADFKNWGGTTFDGHFIAVISDSDNIPVDIINNSEVFTLPTRASTGILTFSTENTSKFLTSNKEVKTEGVYFVLFMSVGSNGAIKGVIGDLNENGAYSHIIGIVISENNSIIADNYEDNNTENTANEFSLNFKNDTATIEISANIHTNSDVDYYKIKLPSDYNYEINSLLHDNNELSIPDGTFYSFDGKYSYKKDNNSWSSPADYSIGDFKYSGANGYLYFKVEPYSSCYMGTYTLELQVIQKEKIVSPTTGLAAYYPFNGNADDESGNGNNGTTYGATLTEDRFGNSNSAFWFNGISDFIKVPDDATLDMTSKISITGWLKKDNKVPWASMLTKGGEFSLENNYALHNSVDNGVIFTGNSKGNCLSTINTPLNEWHFVAFTCDGDSGKIYIDGVADKASFMLLNGFLTPNNSSLYIGADLPGAAEYFSGSLDDIRIYNRELNCEEVALLFNGTFTQVADNKKQSEQHLKVFPNPATHYVTVEFCNPNNRPYDLYISNVIGERVLKIESITNNTITLRNMCLPKGIYLLEMKGQNSQKGKMIVIE